MSDIYRVRYGKDKSGWWVATVPEVPGCHTQGKTVDQARERIKEALSLYLDFNALGELVEVTETYEREEKV
jgi:predicted RNase H-like HicB family nuclease